MTRRTKSFLGAVFLFAILAFMAYIMKDSVETLEPVMPTVFVAFAALAVAGVASFLFNLAETKLELPSFLLGGKLTAVGGVAVFIATLLIMLNFISNDSEQPSESIPDISSGTKYYFSPWKDPRISPSFNDEEIQAVLDAAWKSEIMLEVDFTFRDKSEKPPGFDVREIVGALTFPGVDEINDVALDYECQGSRNDNVVADPTTPWYGCTDAPKQFTVGRDLKSFQLVFKSVSIKWHELQEAILSYEGDILVLDFVVKSILRHPNGSEQSTHISCPIPKLSFVQYVGEVSATGISGNPGYRVKATECKLKDG